MADRTMADHTMAKSIGRTLCSVLAGLALMAGEAAAQAQGFSFSAGVGRRASGAELSRYVDEGGAFPAASASNWWQARYSVDGFSRLGAILPSRATAKPPVLRPLQRAAMEPAIDYATTAPPGAGRFTIDGYLDRNPVTGLMVLQGDIVRIERYQYDRHEQHRFISFSIAKTVIALLIGVAVAEGRIASIDAPAETYVAGLRGTAYGSTPIRHLLTMSSGVKFREVYDGNDDVALLSRATVGGGGPGGAEAVRRFDSREQAAGERWSYASAETFVLALVLRQAIGRPITEYFAEKIWQPIGAESAADWLIDRSGLEVGYTGLNAVLRDYGRLALLLANGGKVGERQVLPSAWLQEMVRPHFSAAQTGRYFGYGFQTWIFPANDGSFALLGVRGQSIFVDPARRLALVQTAVRTSAVSGPTDSVPLWRALQAFYPPTR